MSQVNDLYDALKRYADDYNAEALLSRLTGVVPDALADPQINAMVHDLRERMDIAVTNQSWKNLCAYPGALAMFDFYLKSAKEIHYPEEADGNHLSLYVTDTHYGISGSIIHAEFKINIPGSLDRFFQELMYHLYEVHLAD